MHKTPDQERLDLPQQTCMHCGVNTMQRPRTQAPPSVFDIFGVQAVETGDADTMGQAWQAVKTGSVQPDIDSLNVLIKYGFHLRL